MPLPSTCQEEQVPGIMARPSEESLITRLQALLTQSINGAPFRTQIQQLSRSPRGASLLRFATTRYSHRQRCQINLPSQLLNRLLQILERAHPFQVSALTAWQEQIQGTDHRNHNVSMREFWKQTRILLVLFLVAFSDGDLLGQSAEFRAACRSAVNHYASLAFATYSDARTAAITLRSAIERFVVSPSDQSLEEAKEAWISSRRPYLQSEVFRFYAGPIDDERGLEPMINGWPLDEFYIDYTEDAPNAGIIADLANYPRIDPELLQRHNELAGETAITCGYHAIEFLLWGQDLSSEGPGERPVSDYTNAPLAERRSDYLVACAELLVQHLSIICHDWAPNLPNNYRHRFLEDDPKRSLWYAVYGLRTFAGKELAGERLLVAWDTQAQEDEHSCFSDTTLQDIHYDTLGIRNLFSGDYTRTDGSSVTGPGLNTVFKRISQGRALKLEENLTRALHLANSIPHPFDQTILKSDSDPGRRSILDCVEQLEAIAATLAPFEQHLIQAVNTQ